MRMLLRGFDTNSDTSARQNLTIVLTPEFESFCFENYLRPNQLHFNLDSISVDGRPNSKKLPLIHLYFAFNQTQRGQG